MSESPRYDIAIIGTGPAGISAAITAKVRGKSVLLLGSRAGSRKVAGAHGIRNYPGLPDISGSDFSAALLHHLTAMELPITETQITAVYAMGDYFALQTPADLLEASAVILATGVVTAPPLPGEQPLLGRGVSYCATCDAHFYRGKTVAVLGYNAEADAEADFLAETAAKVLYFPQGQRPVTVSDRVAVLHERPTALLTDDAGSLTALQTDKTTHPVDGVFILRDAVAPGQFVPGLATDGPHAAVDLQMRTNLPGCFACGDLAGLPYQYVKAAGQGNVAALSAVDYLRKLKTNQDNTQTKEN